LSASLISPDRVRSFAAAERSRSARIEGGTSAAMNLLSLINDIYINSSRRCPRLMPKMGPAHVELVFIGVGGGLRAVVVFFA
jgi:hypothetical protein